MVEIKKYYTLYKLNLSGKCSPEERPDLKMFLSQQGSPSVDELDDRTLQIHLVRMWLSERHSAQERYMAEICLRCYISHCLYHWCRKTARNSHHNHLDSIEELYCLVLWDDGQQAYRLNNQYLWQKILRTFDPERAEGSASLSTWVNRLVWQDRELGENLKRLGYIRYSPWKILNTCKPQRFRDLVGEFSGASSSMSEAREEDIRVCCLILEIYQRVYQPSLLQQRRNQKREYLKPSGEQLRAMIELLNQHSVFIRSEDILLNRLIEISNTIRLRQTIKDSGYPAQERLISLDLNSDSGIDSTEGKRNKIEHQIAHSLIQEDEYDSFEEFEAKYQETYLKALDQAIDITISWRSSRIRANAAYNSQQYLLALELLHCQNKSMSEIAIQIGRKRQEQVTTMLKLDRLRDAVSREMQTILFREVPGMVDEFVNDPDRLRELDSHIQRLIEETVSPIFRQAKSAMQTPPSCRPATLFAERLCKYLVQRRLSS